MVQENQQKAFSFFNFYITKYFYNIILVVYKNVLCLSIL